MPALPSSPPPAADPSSRRREAAVTLLTTIGTLMVAVDSTIVILALPTMARDLAAPFSSIIWTILIYLLITAALTTQAGRLGDLFGRGNVYNAGFAIFTIGSAASGFAPTAEILIVARAVQAIGGALMFSNASALIAAVYPPQRRGRAFGFLSFGWGVGAILGILLGGVITTFIGWRYIFFINLPIGVAAVAIGLRSMPVTAREKTGFDVPGFLLFSSMLTLICYGLIEIAVYGASAVNVAYLGVGLALAPIFTWLELRTAQPMIELRAVTHRSLGLALTSGFLQSIGYLAVVFLLTMYLQGLRGLSPLDASLLLVPGYLLGALLGPLMGRRVDRFGTRVFMTLGILCMAAAVVAYSFLDLHAWLGWIPIISVVSGLGTGMFYPSSATAIMSGASPRTFGSISGLRATLMNMGTLLSFVFAISVASASVPRQVAYEVFLGTTNLVGGVGAGFLTGIHASLIAAAGILVVAAALAWLRGPDRAAAPVLIPAAEPAAVGDAK